MKLNCKPGDLAILLRARNPNMQHMVGQIRTVGQQAERGVGYWRFSPNVTVPATGNIAIWLDADMRPINNPGEDATDETLQWCNVPNKVTA